MKDRELPPDKSGKVLYLLYIFEVVWLGTIVVIVCLVRTFLFSGGE